MTKTLCSAIQELKDHDIQIFRTPKNFSFGSDSFCKELFIKCFKEIDKSISDFVFYDEYIQIIDWMTNTKGQGLYLYGDCGRGKTNITQHVIPLLFNLRHNRVIIPFQAYTIPDKFREIANFWAPTIDDLGTELKYNNYGETTEGFNIILNEAERKLNPLFISTNMTISETEERYGSRSLDRIQRLCRMIKFQGESLR